MGQNWCGVVSKNQESILKRRRPVFDAIERGDMTKMYQCLNDIETGEKEEGSFSKWKNKQGRSPLLVACEHARMNMLRYFHSPINASLSARDNYGNNAFHIASLYGHLDVIKWLLETRSELKWKSQNPDALDWQSMHPKNQIVNDRGETPLHLAASSTSRGAARVMKWMLGERRVLASEIHFVKRVSTVASPTKQDISVSIDRIRPEGTLSGQKKAMNELLPGDQVEIRGEGKNGDWYVGVIVRFQNKVSDSKGSDRKQKVVVRYAYAARYSIDSLDKEQNSILHCACKGGNVDVLQIIVNAYTKYRMSLEPYNTRGRTPLQEAAARGHTKIVRILMDLEYLDITKKSKDDGLTAEQIAQNEGYKDCAENLRLALARRSYKEPKLGTVC